MSSSSSQGISGDLSPQNGAAFAHRAGLKSLGFLFVCLFLKVCDLGDQKKEHCLKRVQVLGLGMSPQRDSRMTQADPRGLGKCPRLRGDRDLWILEQRASISYSPTRPQAVPGPQRGMPLCSVLEIRPPYKAPGLSKDLTCLLARRQRSVKGLCGLKTWTCLCKLKTKGCPANILRFLRKA